MDQSEAEAAPADAAYFFLPLPDPLRLPDGLVIETVMPVDFIQLRALHQTSHDETEYEATVTCSVRLFQVEASGKPLYVPALDATMMAAKRGLPFLFEDQHVEPSSADSGTDYSGLVWTVAEVAVPLAPPVDPDGDALSDAFDRAVEAVRQLQSAYTVATKETVTLLAQENLPPFVPATLRWLKTGVPVEDRWSDGMLLFHINNNIMVHQRGPDLSELELQAFELALTHASGERVFLGYLDMWRDARLALRQRGDYRAAVVAAETAAEVLLDDLLLHMLWEEGVPPEVAAEECFKEQGLAKRVRTHYHERLGGNWSITQGVVADWRRDLSTIRHRVVHGGYNPTRLEAWAAVDALDELEEFVADRLADRLRTYPRTAMSFLGKRGLEKRGRWRPWLEELSNDPAEPNWKATFARWRWVVEDCLEEKEFREADPSDDWVSVLRIDTDGTEQWWTHDTLRRRVALTAEPPDMTDEARTALRARIDAVDPLKEPLTMGWIGEPALPADEATWVREHEILPLHGVMLR